MTGFFCRYPTAFFSLGIAHNYGVIRDIQWCPSGCWEDGKTSSTSSCWADGETTPTDTDGELRRLGLLAVACSDGKLRILRYSCVCVCVCVCVCMVSLRKSSVILWSLKPGNSLTFHTATFPMAYNESSLLYSIYSIIVSLSPVISLSSLSWSHTLRVKWPSTAYHCISCVVDWPLYMFQPRLIAWYWVRE